MMLITNPVLIFTALWGVNRAINCAAHDLDTL